jgi:hypothetical protein
MAVSRVPCQVTVGPKALAAGKVESNRRSVGERELVTPDVALERLSG